MKILIRNHKTEKWQKVNSAAYTNESELQKLLAEDPAQIAANRNIQWDIEISLYQIQLKIHIFKDPDSISFKQLIYCLSTFQYRIEWIYEEISCINIFFD